MRNWIVVCAGLLLLLAAWGVRAQDVPPKASVAAATARAPVLSDLRGKSCEDARQELRLLHFVLDACPVGKATGAFPAGTINSQSLKPGTPASMLDGLRVTVEPGPAPTPVSPPAAVVPDLRGKTCAQAEAELRSLNLRLAECRPGQARTRVPAGTINAQSHAPGTPVGRVDALRVTYEEGPAPAPAPASRPDPTPAPAAGRSRDAAAAAAAAGLAAVLAAAVANAEAARLPDLRGMTCDQARNALRPLRVALGECAPGEATGAYPPGTISAQSYTPGTPVSRVDKLYVKLEPVLAAPAASRTLPNLRGMTCDEAASALGALKLRYSRCAPGAAVAGATPGRVTEQEPPAGAALPLAVPIVLGVQPAPQVTVPALIGMGETEATRSLSSRQLSARSSGPTAKLGRRVMSQSPVAGTAVAPGSEVAISLGLTVPRLLDLDCAAARARAAEFGHRAVECVSRPADTPGAVTGHVFEQTPKAGGAAVAAPAEIRVVVWAARPVAVPDVREAALDAAIALIEKAQLVARPDNRQGARTVTEQTPAPGEIVDAGSIVRLGTQEVVEVPDVVGQTLAATQARLEQSRLSAAADAQDHADERIVRSQSPAAGARVSVGSMVRVSTTRLATVPDIGGMTCAEAREALEPDTFRLACTEEDSWRVTVFGTPRVETQQPAARTRAETGTMIVTVARAPLPERARWLGSVPLAVVAGVVAAPLLALALWFGWPARHVPGEASHGAPRAGRTIVPPVAAPPRLPSFEWRVEADAAPAVSLRAAVPEGKARPRARHLATAWRVVRDEGSVLLREFDASEGR